MRKKESTPGTAGKIWARQAWRRWRSHVTQLASLCETFFIDLNCTCQRNGLKREAVTAGFGRVEALRLIAQAHFTRILGSLAAVQCCPKPRSWSLCLLVLMSVNFGPFRGKSWFSQLLRHGFNHQIHRNRNNMAHRLTTSCVRVPVVKWWRGFCIAAAAAARWLRPGTGPGAWSISSQWQLPADLPPAC